MAVVPNWWFVNSSQVVRGIKNIFHVYQFYHYYVYINYKEISDRGRVELSNGL